MDGTGDLFADFVALLPGWIEPRIVSYPRDKKLSYAQLSSLVKSAFPSNRPFVILAESFSAPLAVTLAAENPDWLKGLVLCAGFVSPPRRDVLSRLAFVLAPELFSFGLPASVCRRYLVGNAAQKNLVNIVRSAVSSVSSAVLAHRLRSVLSCNAERELRSVSVPLLYIFGTEDRLVRRASFHEIHQAKPDAQLTSIEAPHLILQTKPREAAGGVTRFLQMMCSEPDQRTAAV
jgi:pimeloyl-ACP methyl ester carboxylesterase